MSSRKQHTAPPDLEQLDRRLNEQWEQEIVPNLPKELEDQARTLGAFVRQRHLRNATDLLRGLLTYALAGLSFRRLGIWGVLTGMGSLSEKAWRKRLAASAAWIGWLLGTVIATAETPDWMPEGLTGTGVVLTDFSSVKVVGGTGDDLRVHLGYNLLTASMDHVVVSDHHQAESIPKEMVRKNWIYVGDSGYRQAFVARIINAGAEVVVRRHGHDLHLEEEDGTGIKVKARVKALSYGESHSLFGWVNLPGKGQRAFVRVVVFHLPKEQAHKAREAKLARTKAKGRKPNEEVLWWAERVVIVTTLAEKDWPDELILRLYRARWQIELLFKRIKTFLKMYVIPIKQIDRASLVVQLLLIGWALQEQEAQCIREVLHKTAIVEQETGEEEPRIVSSWALASISLQSLKQAVWGGWTRHRFLMCLPWLRRYLCHRPRKRVHQETEIRAFLLSLSSPLWQRQKEVALA
ncbi:MAG TPA: transposase [Ktedonobacteraceae bacterium]